MRKLSAIFLGFVLALSFAACDSMKQKPEESVENYSSEVTDESYVSSEIEEEVSQESSEAEEGSAADAPADEDTVVTEVETPEITDEDVIAAYKACTAFRDFWFRGGNSSAMTEETTEIEGALYCRYSYDDIDSYEAFEAAALELVSEEIFAAWQENFRYIDYEGKLYGPVGYGSGDQDGFSHIEAECVRASEAKFEVKVGEYYFAEYITGAESDETILVGEYTCDYEFSGEKWVFTAFSYTPVSAFAG